MTSTSNPVRMPRTSQNSGLRAPDEDPMPGVTCTISESSVDDDLELEVQDSSAAQSPEGKSPAVQWWPWRRQPRTKPRKGSASANIPMGSIFGKPEQENNRGGDKADGADKADEEATPPRWHRKKVQLTQLGLLLIVLVTACAIGIPLGFLYGITYKTLLECKKDNNSVFLSHQYFFREFKELYGKEYKNATVENHRFEIFMENVIFVLEENMKLWQAGEEEIHGFTKFLDYTPDEFESIFLNSNNTATAPNRRRSLWESEQAPAPAPAPERQLKNSPTDGGCNGGNCGGDDDDEGRGCPPNYRNHQTDVTLTQINWHTRGKVSSVNDQGQCSSCWAFSAVETIESRYAILKGGSAPKMSVQQAKACTYGNSGGCGLHGSYDDAWDYAGGQGGLNSWGGYPLNHLNSISCQTNKEVNRYQFQLTSNYRIYGNDEGAMYNRLQSYGPISAMVDARNWRTYNGGIISSTNMECSRSRGNINHAVQIVGLHTTDHTWENSYWIVRNSWGTSFGYSGYAYVQYGCNTCGIATFASQPTMTV